MDTVTHLVTGAALGEAILGRTAGKKAMLWGALAANVPDIDALTALFLPDLDSIVLHRGITHSLIVAMMAGPLLGYWLWKVGRLPGMLITWMLLVTSNLLLHDFLDACTAYGTGLLLPFSEQRYSFNTLFVVDPSFTLPVLISVAVLLMLRTGHSHRLAWNRFAWLWVSFYLVSAFWNHNRADSALERSLSRQGIRYTDRYASPTLGNILLWQVVARDTNGTWSGYYSVFDGDHFPFLRFIPYNDALLGERGTTGDVRKLKGFSNGFYTITRDGDHLRFNVLKFGQVRGWDDPASRFAFSFDLVEGADNSMVVQQGRVEGMKRGVLASMWRRIREGDHSIPAISR